jgi:hypothetical protein
MNRILLLLFLMISSSLFCQNKADTLEGWWTMIEQVHYFEDQSIIEMEFITNNDLFDMDILYRETALIPGTPVQIVIVAFLRNEKLIVSQLEIVPQGCDD